MASAANWKQSVFSAVGFPDRTSGDADAGRLRSAVRIRSCGPRQKVAAKSDQELPKISSKAGFTSSPTSQSNGVPVQEKSSTFHPLRATIANRFDTAKKEVLATLMHFIFHETDEPPNHHFLGNFAPVPEIGERVTIPASAVEGAVPKDFPPGVYIRNGPNPQYGGRRLTSAFGVLDYHWFEGDGMLHATYFQEGGQVSYLNRYVRTRTYEVEKAKGKRTWMPNFDGDLNAIALSYIFNTLRFGKSRVTANTHVFKHAGKFYAIAEGDMPHEIDLSDLSTKGVWDGCSGSWKLPNFTAHPCHDPQTQELVFFGCQLTKPHAEIGIWSADGEKLVQRVDVGLDRCVLSHDIAITKNYTLYFDFPLVIDLDRFKNGGQLLEFQPDGTSRVGILPRYGDTSSIRWFPVQTGFSWHKFNSFEDGDEVVVFGLWARRPAFILPPPPCTTNEQKSTGWARGAQPVPKDTKDPAIDGELCSHVHEWRFNMCTGEVVERILSDFSYSGEFPCINRSYVGVKNRYAYMCLDVELTTRADILGMGGWVKMTLPQSMDEGMEVEIHKLGSGWGASEPSFVVRPNAQDEDDGWIVGYIHNLAQDISYLYILDAQDFTGRPVAKIQLPQRVPYGFHGTYFYN